MLSEILRVKAGHKEYTVEIGNGLGQKIQALCSELSHHGKKGVVLTTKEVEQNWKDYLQSAFKEQRIIVLPSGEQIKSFQMLEGICEELSLEKIDRNGFIFIAGGGVIGDLGGFAAATYLRGINYYQAPTTLMAMIDSSIGGKTGINLKTAKNLVGAFYNPKQVFTDLNFLTTLPIQEFNAGMAEVIKYGLLGEKWILDHLMKAGPINPKNENLLEIIKRCCLTKINIVTADEKESTGVRMYLNLGHTFGHAIEAVAGYGNYLHGEAVGLGLIMMARLSQELGYIHSSLVNDIRHLVHQYKLPTTLRKPLSTNDLVEAMYRDKKNVGGKLRFVVIEDIGKVSIEYGVDETLIRNLWKEFGAN